MKRLGLVVVLGLALVLGGCGRHSTGKEKVRGPAVAGMFYPRHESDLKKNVDDLLAEAKPLEVKNLRGLVCPHAGYQYSGKTAALAYKLLVGRDFRTVVVLAPSHYAAFDGAAVDDSMAFETPLGLVPVSAKAAELGKVKPFAINPACQVERPGFWKASPKDLPPFGEDTPHTWEHSLEVQLPFLQRTLKKFELVPVVIGQADAEAVAKGLAPMLDDRTLIVASSDLSHYHPYDAAKSLDTTCVRAVCDLNIEWMEQQEACGKSPILALMHLARQKGWKTKLLDYRNSGDTTDDKSRVVGYAAIAFYEPAEKAAEEPLAAAGFTPAQQKFMLELARKSVVACVNGENPPSAETAVADPALAKARACFVTLTKRGELRGCIGSIFPQEPLGEAVIRRAKSAAIEDPRFPPVTASELGELEIEVSVLTLPSKLEFKSPEELLKKLRPKVDGVVLRVQGHGATYLPQVWEQIPQKESFLGHLAEKAGLSASAWRDPGAAVMVYQVEAFKEKKEKAKEEITPRRKDAKEEKAKK